MHLMIVSNTCATHAIGGADRDWVNLLNEMGPERVRVTWVGVDNSESLRDYLDDKLQTRFIDFNVAPFYELFHEAMYRRRSSLGWAKIIVAHLRSLVRPTLQLRELMRDDGVDVIITNTSVVWLGAIYAAMTGIPHVWCVKEFLDPTIRACRNYARLIEKLCKVIVVPSRAMANVFSKRDRKSVV